MMHNGWCSIDPGGYALIAIISSWELFFRALFKAFFDSTTPPRGRGRGPDLMPFSIAIAPSASPSRLAPYFLALLFLPAFCSAAQDRLIMGGDTGGLPSLPGERRSEESDALDVDTGTIALRERGFDNTLGLRLDGYQAGAPSIAVEKGWLVSSRLGVGGTYTMSDGSSELLLNGVYAPRHDVRIQLSASQLRRDDFAALNGDPKTVMQTSYLSSIRKRWAKSRIHPEAAFAVYTSRAVGAGRWDSAMDGLEMGTMAGAMLKLAARSIQRERIEVSYRTQRVVYDSALAADSRDTQALASLDYVRTFDDCSQIRGRYSAGPGVAEADVRYESGAFSIGFLQTSSGDYNDKAIRFGYAISLGRGGKRSAACAAESGSPSPFRTIVDAATLRSPYLPSETLTRTGDIADVPG
jgi:hypothetical protein